MFLGRSSRAQGRRCSTRNEAGISRMNGKGEVRVVEVRSFL